jgi:transmembrane sensor
MSHDLETSDRRREEAIAWRVRLDSDLATENDWQAFQAWLVLDGARAAYDAIDLLCAEVEAGRDTLAAALEEPQLAPPENLQRRSCFT